MASHTLSAVAASAGIGTGKIFVVSSPDLSYEAGTCNDAPAEKERFEKAVNTFKEKILEKSDSLKEKAGPKEALILDRQLLLISDPSMSDEMLRLIAEGHSAEEAVDSVCNIFIRMFSGMDDELMCQRAADILDVRNSMLKLLLGIKDTDIASVPKGSILVARDLPPSLTSQIVRENINGIITEEGTRTSHIAIIARAMEIPLVCGAERVLELAKDGDTAIVDGDQGLALINPDREELDKYSELFQKRQRKIARLSQYLGKETVTADGQKLSLFCNIGTPEEAARVLEQSGEGIGLFRSEFLFMDKKAEPSEEEQFEAYKKIAEMMEGRPVIVRTLDVGGDKDIPYLNLKKEENPFLGLRAIRYSLAERQRFSLQLRALLRASAYGKVKIMIPLVTCIEELRSVKSMVEDIKTELDGQHIPYDKNIEIGCMIETPSASLIADILAREADFFSIGTNDLIQYTMCADRGNSGLSYLDSPFHPAVLRSVRHIIGCGKNAGIPVGMCGEAAADPLLIPLLISFGLKEFSVDPSSVLKCRHDIHKWNKKDADELTEKIMSLDNIDEIKKTLAD